MLLNKSYLLLALLSVFVISSVCNEEKPRKTESNVDTKKNVLDRLRDGNRRKEKPALSDDEDHDDIDGRLAEIASLADPRNLPFHAQGNNFRTRARWPGQLSSSSSSSFSSPFDNPASGTDQSRMDLSNFISSMVPSPSQDHTPILSSATSCHSLVDSQYPIFSDVCGAVPQARYSLPNTFGHRERWQAAQALNAFVSAALDPSCIRSLRLLICPVLFPPCPSRHEPPAVLPCQSYCRAVKARCGTPALDLLHCEVLPQSSDLCPASQTYGSFAPPGASSSMSQASQVADGFPSSNFHMSRSYSPLRSLLAAQGYQSPLAQSSLSSTPQQATGSMNFNNGVAPTMDSLNPLFADFSPRSFSNDPRQSSRYSPLARSSFDTRSMVEARPQTDAQFSSGSRPAAISSVVKA